MELTPLNVPLPSPAPPSLCRSAKANGSGFIQSGSSSRSTPPDKLTAFFFLLFFFAILFSREGNVRLIDRTDSCKKRLCLPLNNLSVLLNNFYEPRIRASTPYVPPPPHSPRTPRLFFFVVALFQPQNAVCKHRYRSKVIAAMSPLFGTSLSK